MLFPDPATLYATDVLSGREVAGPYVRAAARRHMADLRRSDIYFDTAAADRVCRFFEERLLLSEGQFEGKPFKLHCSQRFILRSLFGWKRAADDLRRFRRAYIEKGKGNGKSPLAAGIGLYGMLADDEPGAQIYSAATSRDQADILFQDAVKMARAAPELAKRITFSGRDHVWNMAALGARQAGSFFRPVSSNVGRRGSGPRPHFVLIDELHEAPDRNVMNILERGFKFRRQPLLFIITNSGFDRKSVCWEERENAIAAADGDLARDSTFAYVCALDSDEDPLVDRACRVKANPLLGTILTPEYLDEVAGQALALPGRQNSILRLHFCMWTDAETAWIKRSVWETCEDSTLSLEQMSGRACRAGLDLSSRKDLTATALVFEDGEVEDPKTGKMLPKLAAFVHGYTPASTLDERARKDRAPYDQWVKKGFITATPGPVVRFPYVISDLVENQNDYDLQAIAYDRHLITRFEEDAGEMGADLPLVEHPQGWNRRKDNPLWMPGSVEHLEDMVLQGRLRVHVNPALRSAVAGAKFLTSPAGLRRFDKAGATQRIDMLIALTQAIGAWYMEAPGGGGKTVYEVLAQQRAADSKAVTQPHAGAKVVQPVRQYDEDEDDL